VDGGDGVEVRRVVLAPMPGGVLEGVEPVVWLGVGVVAEVKKAVVGWL
jgi:hypothetical protein